MFCDKEDTISNVPFTNSSKMHFFSSKENCPCMHMCFGLFLTILSIKMTNFRAFCANLSFLPLIVTENVAVRFARIMSIYNFVYTSRSNWKMCAPLHNQLQIDALAHNHDNLGPVFSLTWLRIQIHFIHTVYQWRSQPF